MKKLFTFIGLFVCIYTNANNIKLDESQPNLIQQNSNESQYKISEEGEVNLEDDYFCRVCVTQYVKSPVSGTYIGFTACAGNVFTSCETATDKATDKLVMKLAQVFEDM